MNIFIPQRQPPRQQEYNPYPPQPPYNPQRPYEEPTYIPPRPKCDERTVEYNFVIQQGTSFDIDVEYRDDQGNPFNLTGYDCSCVAQFRDKVFTIHAEPTELLNGKMHLWMTPEETRNIFTFDYKYCNKTDYTYQLDLVSPSGFVYRIMIGIISVQPMSGKIQ